MLLQYSPGPGAVRARGPPVLQGPLSPLVLRPRGALLADPAVAGGAESGNGGIVLIPFRTVTAPVGTRPRPAPSAQLPRPCSPSPAASSCSMATAGTELTGKRLLCLFGDSASGGPGPGPGQQQPHSLLDGDWHAGLIRVVIPGPSLAVSVRGGRGRDRGGVWPLVSGGRGSCRERRVHLNGAKSCNLGR